MSQKISNSRIEEMSERAARDGFEPRRDLCERALRGDKAARAECERLIRAEWHATSAAMLSNPRALRQG